MPRRSVEALTLESVGHGTGVEEGCPGRSSVWNTHPRPARAPAVAVLARCTAAPARLQAGRRGYRVLASGTVGGAPQQVSGLWLPSAVKRHRPVPDCA